VANRKPKPERAVRVAVEPGGAGDRDREAEVARARELGLAGWTREDEEVVRLHAEGGAEAVAALLAWLEEATPGLEVEEVKPEGHEQFAVRGVPAGRFEVIPAERGYELRLEVGDEVRRWALPREPSMVPAEKRFAIELDPDPAAGAPTAEPWDGGQYEQGGRVPWPEAIGRGHAVFVLHGGRLRGGFALQRIGAGDRPRWLLVKRRDEHAAAGTD
jgi:hypothetical protein